MTAAMDHDYYDGFRTFSWLADLVGLPIDQVRRRHRLQRPPPPPPFRGGAVPPVPLSSGRFLGGNRRDIDRRRIAPSYLSASCISRTRICRSDLGMDPPLDLAIAPRSCFRSEIERRKRDETRNGRWSVLANYAREIRI